MKKYIVKLSKDEREDLRDITYKGKHKSQKILVYRMTAPVT